MTIPEEQKIKLESMQIKGIRAMIWQNIEKENIESRLLQIKKQNYTNDLRKFVNSQSRAVLIELIKMSPEIYPQTIDNNEYFTLTSGSLTILKSPNYEKLKASDIQDFAPIVNRKLTHSSDVLQSSLKQLKEKCSHPTNDECSQCKNKPICDINDVQCILKLFEDFEGYTPQPHQGHEFGDVSMLVTYNGNNLTFLGAAKSVNLRTPKTTKASALGREIIQQVIDAFNDNRAEIVGVIYPDMIDDQLKYLLFHEAKVHNKKLVILDKEFMLRLLDKYLTDKNL